MGTTVTPPQKKSGVEKTLLISRRLLFSFGKIGEKGKTIEGLKVSFSIQQTSESNSNQCKLSVWGLNDNSRAVFNQGGKDIVVKLEVGYGTRIGVLFAGNVTKSGTERDGASYITKIEVGEGQKGLEEAHFEKSYDKGIGLKKILEDVMETLKDAGDLAIGVFDQIKEKVTGEGLSVSGMSKDIIDKITDKLGAEWSIQNNTIQPIVKNSHDGSNVVVITPQTGLIGSPIRKELGVEFRTLILPSLLRPGKRVKIVSREVNGVFVLRKTTFKGDTHGNNWYMTGTAIPLEISTIQTSLGGVQA